MRWSHAARSGSRGGRRRQCRRGERAATLDSMLRAETANIRGNVLLGGLRRPRRPGWIRTGTRRPRHPVARHPDGGRRHRQRATSLPTARGDQGRHGTDGPAATHEQSGPPLRSGVTAWPWLLCRVSPDCHSGRHVDFATTGGPPLTRNAAGDELPGTRPRLIPVCPQRMAGDSSAGAIELQQFLALHPIFPLHFHLTPLSGHGPSVTHPT